MKTKLFYFLLTISLVSCAGSKEYGAFVYEKYSKILKEEESKKSDYIGIRTDSLVQFDTLIKTEKLKSFFLPALIFWIWDSKLNVTLIPKAEPIHFAPILSIMLIP